ncbi:unnamed protein product [Paramecium pentaurelia]|uniref:C2HC/C3H-type domain-containing protein n=1 Tax=Paramecium pentaurelia TaxID=43138 RepID=A0A8S1WYF9_9CILI|nr:unnamed protein product [Paramecium pentaurelia]
MSNQPKQSLYEAFSRQLKPQMSTTLSNLKPVVNERPSTSKPLKNLSNAPIRNHEDLTKKTVGRSPKRSTFEKSSAQNQPIIQVIDERPIPKVLQKAKSPQPTYQIQNSNEMIKIKDQRQFDDRPLPTSKPSLDSQLQVNQNQKFQNETLISTTLPTQSQQYFKVQPNIQQTANQQQQNLVGYNQQLPAQEQQYARLSLQNNQTQRPQVQQSQQQQPQGQQSQTIKSQGQQKQPQLEEQKSQQFQGQSRQINQEQIQRQQKNIDQQQRQQQQQRSIPQQIQFQNSQQSSHQQHQEYQQQYNVKKPINNQQDMRGLQQQQQLQQQQLQQQQLVYQKQQQIQQFQQNQQQQQTQQIQEQPIKTTQQQQPLYQQQIQQPQYQMQQLQNQKNQTTQMEQEGDEILLECPEGCGRSFNKKALEKHAKICQKVFQQKRKLDEEEEGFRPPPPPQKKQQQQKQVQKQNESKSDKPKWKAQSEAFRAIIKQGKGEQLTKEEQASLKNAMDATQDLVLCKFCNRKFNSETAKKHIAFCETKAKQAITQKKKK